MTLRQYAAIKLRVPNHPVSKARAAIAIAAAAESQQAEPVRLTDEQINGADGEFQEASFWRVVKFARTIEAAVLRANGFKVEG